MATAFGLGYAAGQGDHICLSTGALAGHVVGAGVGAALLAALGAGVGAALLAALGAAAGSLIRSQLAGVIGTLVWCLVLESLLGANVTASSS